MEFLMSLDRYSATLSIRGCNGCAGDLRIDILEGHISTSLCHLANISYRIGSESSPDGTREAIQDYKEALGIFKRFKDHLAANGVGFKRTPAVLSPWLEMDSAKKIFGGFDFKCVN